MDKDKTNTTEDTKENVVKIIIENSVEIEKLLNENLLKTFGKLHNVLPENNKLFLKQEIVARRGYFFGTKKKYALHVVSKEGVDIDKLDTIGLVTRRSDYPSATKEKISELLNLIVMSENYNVEDIKKYVEDCRKELYTLCKNGDKSIGRPSTYTKPLNKYKGTIPHHIRAMELWNRCEYEYFSPGSKGYLFKIKGIDPQKAPDKAYKIGVVMTDKDKYIALPYEEEKLPSYFIIDVNAMMKFVWNDREKELLSPIYDEVFSPVENLGILTF